MSSSLSRFASGVSKTRKGGSFSRFVYANLFRSNAVFVTTVVISAVVFTSIYDELFEEAWKINNKGKLFDDVIPKRFPGLPPNTEPEAAAESGEETEAEAEAAPAEE